MKYLFVDGFMHGKVLELEPNLIYWEFYHEIDSSKKYDPSALNDIEIVTYRYGRFWLTAEKKVDVFILDTHKTLDLSTTNKMFDALLIASELITPSTSQ